MHRLRYFVLKRKLDLDININAYIVPSKDWMCASGLGVHRSGNQKAFTLLAGACEHTDMKIKDKPCCMTDLPLSCMTLTVLPPVDLFPVPV